MVAATAVPVPAEQKADDEWAPAGAMPTPSAAPGAGAAAGGGTMAATTATTTTVVTTATTATHRCRMGRGEWRRATAPPPPPPPHGRPPPTPRHPPLPHGPGRVAASDPGRVRRSRGAGRVFVGTGHGTTSATVVPPSPRASSGVDEI